MYCPFCQKEAPNVNELYRIIDQDKDLKSRIKMIGIGAGNSPFEVNTFRTPMRFLFPFSRTLTLPSITLWGRSGPPILS